jgi:hypothetical protein
VAKIEKRNEIKKNLREFNPHHICIFKTLETRYDVDCGKGVAK